MSQQNEINEVQKQLQDQKNITKILQREFAAEKAKLMTYIHSLEKLNNSKRDDSKIQLQTGINSLEQKLNLKMSELKQFKERSDQKEKDLVQKISLLEQDHEKLKEEKIICLREIENKQNLIEDLEIENNRINSKLKSIEESNQQYFQIHNDELEQELFQYSLQRDLMMVNQQLKIKNDAFIEKLKNLEIKFEFTNTENNSLITKLKSLESELNLKIEEQNAIQAQNQKLLNDVTILKNSQTQLKQQFAYEKDRLMQQLQNYERFQKITEIAKKFNNYPLLEKKLPNETQKIKQDYQEIIINWQQICHDENDLRTKANCSQQLQDFTLLNNQLQEIVQNCEKLNQLIDQKKKSTQERDALKFLTSTQQILVVVLSSLNQMKELIKNFIAQESKNLIYGKFHSLMIQILKRILRNMLEQAYQNVWSFYEQILKAFSLQDQGAEVIHYNRMLTQTLMEDIKLWDDDNTIVSFYRSVAKFQQIEGIIRRIIPGSGVLERELIEAFLNSNQSVLWLFVLELENFLEQMKFIKN